jgi:hypothetical protein
MGDWQLHKDMPVVKAWPQWNRCTCNTYLGVGSQGFKVHCSNIEPYEGISQEKKNMERYKGMATRMSGCPRL